MIIYYSDSDGIKGFGMGWGREEKRVRGMADEMSAHKRKGRRERWRKKEREREREKSGEWSGKESCEKDANEKGTNEKETYTE